MNAKPEGSSRSGNNSNLKHQAPPLSSKNKGRQRQNHNTNQIHTQQSEIEEIDEENEDFVPFMSSTDNELTDLNTDFNTDRPGCENIAPQSTYKSR